MRWARSDTRALSREPRRTSPSTADGHVAGRPFAGGLFLCVVHDHGRLVVGNLGWGAVTLGDHLLPRGGVHLLGGFAALPQVNASSDLVLPEEIILADQSRRALILGCRLLIIRSRVLEGHALWQLKADDGSDHGSTPH